MYYVFAILLLLITFACLRRLRFDAWSIALILVASGLYYFQFYHTTWDMFAPDVQAHVFYLEYIAQHGTFPTTEQSSAARHPPGYYLLGAGVYWLAQHGGMTEPLLAVRHLSMACFLVFIVMSARLLRLLLLPVAGCQLQLPYYAALSLLLFWPVGVTMGGRITCDVLLYAGEAGALYYLARWCLDKTATSLSGVLIWSGISVLAKNSGVVMLGISAIALLSVHCGKWHRSVWMAIVFALVSVVLTARHGWILSDLPPLHYDFSEAWHVFTGFSPVMLMTDVNMIEGRDQFWNMLLHSLWLGGAIPVISWKIPAVAMLLTAVWCSIVGYLFIGINSLRHLPLPERRLLLLYAVFACVVVAAMLLLRIETRNILCADGRYIYPLVPVIALCYGKMMVMHQHAGRVLAYKAGIFLVVSIVPLTLAMVLSQFVLVS